MTGPGPWPPAQDERNPRQLLRLWGLRLIGRLYRRSQAEPAHPRSVLLIRPDHLGDMLFLTPALRALRRNLPDGRIVVLAGPWGAEVLKGNPDVDTVRTCPFPGFERGRGAQTRLPRAAPYLLLQQMAGELRRERYDTAVVLRFDHWWGAWLAAAAGINRRIGYNRPETRPFLTQALPYSPDRHEVEQNVALMQALVPGGSWEAGPTRYVVAEADRDWATAWLTAQGVEAGRPLIAIHPGAGAPVKQWSTLAWATVADQLARSTRAQIVLTGGSGERALAQAVASAATVPIWIAAGETSLGRLAALLERCTVVAGADCGPLHLAVAVGVPTVHLYGPVSPAKFGPWGDAARNRVLLSDWPCVSCNRLDWPAAELDRHRCMDAITPEQVIAAVQELLDRRPAGSSHR